MNWQTILVAGLLLGIIVAIIVKKFWDKRNGKSSCSCGCSGCAMSGECHKSDQ